jgi:hypothetical protein
MLLINTLLDYNDNRPDHVKIKSVGVTTTQYQRWKSDPGFQAYYNQRVSKIVGEDIGEVDRALFDAARSGDIGAIKLLKAYTGQYRESSGNSAIDVMHIIIKIQEILVTHIKDKELLASIGTNLKPLRIQVA